MLAAPPKDPRRERLFLLVENPDNIEVLTEIRKLARDNAGLQEVILVIPEGENKRPLRMPFKVEANAELLSAYKKLLGEDHVKIN